MKTLIYFLIAFGLVFILNFIFVVLNKKKVGKIFESYAALLIKNKFKLTFKDASPRKFALVMTFADSFICACAFAILTLFNNIYLGFIVAALALFVLILGIYSIIGLIYKKKEGSKNV